MLKINLSPDELPQLQELIFNAHHPLVQKKALAVLARAQNVETGQIAAIIGSCNNTVRNYLHEYQEAGIESISKTKFRIPSSELEMHADAIRAIFEANPPSTVAQAVFMIKELTGIERSHRQVYYFMKNLGLKFRKSAAIPAKADPVEQERCIVEDLEPAIREAEEGKSKLFFLDAAHFVHGVFLAQVWCFARIFVRAPSGRSRYNVLGALDAITKQIVTITNENYVNSITICEMLRKLRDICGTIPIAIVLDNARYQKCALVQNLAFELNIKLLYIPSYSPNLNIIERYWKYVKKNCLNNKYYEKFTSFKEAIDTCIAESNSNTKKISELKNLLTLNFQRFACSENSKLAA